MTYKHVLLWPRTHSENVINMMCLPVSVHFWWCLSFSDWVLKIINGCLFSNFAHMVLRTKFDTDLTCADLNLTFNSWSGERWYHPEVLRYSFTPQDDVNQLLLISLGRTVLREKSPSSFEAHRAIDMIIIFIIKFIFNLYCKQYVSTCHILWADRFSFCLLIQFLHLIFIGLNNNLIVYMLNCLVLFNIS